MTQEKLGVLVCFACGYHIPVYKDDLGFEELECPKCECTNNCPEKVEELEAYNTSTTEEVNKRLEATHIRIMARGEDHTEFTIENMVPKDIMFLDLILDGLRARYPGATIFTEDEETTSLGYMQSLMDDVEY